MIPIDSQTNRVTPVDYVTAQQEISAAIERSDVATLQRLLGALIEQSDQMRTSAENLFLYRTLGELYQRSGDAGEAARAYQRAFEADSRDRAVLEALAQMAMEEGADEQALPVLRRLLIHHREAIAPSTLAAIQRSLGEIHHRQGRVTEAEMAFSKALEATPGDAEILKRILEFTTESADAEAARAMRARLLTTIPQAESRASVLVAIGDDYRASGDLEAAIETYERALAEHETSARALVALRETASQAGDWAKVVDATARLARTREDRAERVAFLEAAAALTLEHLDDVSQAVHFYNQILDLDPYQGPAFQQIHDQLQKAGEWVELDRNLTVMIQRHEGEGVSDPTVSRQFCLMLHDAQAQLRVGQLERPLAAAHNLEALIALEPDDLERYRTLARIYVQHEDHLDDARVVVRRMIARAGDDMAALQDGLNLLAWVHSQRQKSDRVLCVYRVLECFDGVDDQIASYVEGHRRQYRWPIIRRPFDARAWEALRPDAMDPTPGDMFEAAYPALVHSFGDDALETYSLRKTDALDLTQKTLFSNVYNGVAHLLCYNEAPPVYQKSGSGWLINGHVDPPAMFVDPALLSGRGMSELAFICGRALTLFQPRYYVLTRLGYQLMPRVLQAFIMFARPDAGVNLADDQQRILKDLKKHLPEPNAARLRELIGAMLDQGTHLDLKRWSLQVDELASRVGVLLCDDVRSAASLLSQEPEVVQQHFRYSDFNTRVLPLIMWTVSEPYMNLREQVGVAIRE